MNTRDLQKAFEGKDSAYLLVYRARHLRDATGESVSIENMIPPEVWTQKVIVQNEQLGKAACCNCMIPAYPP